MVSVSFTISDELKAKMEKFPWINWSEVSREEAIERDKINEDFEAFNKIVSKSKLTEEDALELGRKVNKSLHERYEKLYKSRR